MKNKIIEIIKDNCPMIEDLDANNFIEDGLLDSFDIVTLVSEFDKAFGISIDGEKIVPEYFNSVDDMVKLVEESK